MVQATGDVEQEMAILTREPDGSAVLWLRAREFDSVDEAKRTAGEIDAVTTAHMKWMLKQG